jgi:hypothetical protein
MKLNEEISRIKSLLFEQEEETSKFGDKMKDALWTMDVNTAQRYVGGYKNYVDIMFDGDINKFFEEKNIKPYHISVDGMDMYLHDAFVDVIGLRPTGRKGGRTLGSFTWKSGGINFRLDVTLIPKVGTPWAEPNAFGGQKYWRVIGRSGDSGWGFPFLRNTDIIGKRGRQQVFKQIIDRFGL